MKPIARAMQKLLETGGSLPPRGPRPPRKGSEVPEINHTKDQKVPEIYAERGPTTPIGAHAPSSREETGPRPVYYPSRTGQNRSRREMISFMVTAEEKRLIKRAVKNSRLNLSEYIRRIIFTHIKRALSEQRDNPPDPVSIPEEGVEARTSRKSLAPRTTRS